MYVNCNKCTIASTEITQTHSIALPISPSRSSSSPGDHSAMPLSPRASVNFPLSSSQQRPHTPLQSSPNVLQANSPNNAPLIRVFLPHGQHTLVSMCLCVHMLFIVYNQPVLQWQGKFFAWLFFCEDGGFISTHVMATWLRPPEMTGAHSFNCEKWQ